MSGYNTNLEAEFHVLSTLHRLGADADLTLGSKSVDIAVIRDAVDSLTIDVKGLADTTGWPIDNLKPGTPRHFAAFACYQGNMGDPRVAPCAGWCHLATWRRPSDLRRRQSDRRFASNTDATSARVSPSKH